jgi:hypothetical protein
MSAVDVRKAPDDGGRPLGRPATRGRRRPVLSFVGVILLVALALAAVGRSGVAAPQARLTSSGSIGDGSVSYAGTYSLVNDGLRPVEVVAIRSPVPVRLAPVGQDPGLARDSWTRRAEDLPAYAPFTVPRTGRRTLVVPLPCADGTGRPLTLEVVIRSVDLGLRRKITVDLGDGLACP